MTKLKHLHITSFVILIVWTMLVLASGAFSISVEKKKTIELAKKEARITFNKDQAFRSWATDHGGVYVPISPKTQPNEYLSHIPERDITTPSGKKLTLMNPAYMIRQVMHDYEKEYGTQGRITSLKTLNPANNPDNWEIMALEKLASGMQEEVFEIDTTDGGQYLRLMRPMYTAIGCLKCHAVQGYKVGELRGGVGVKVAMAPYFALEKISTRDIKISYFIFWFVGIISLGLFFGWSRQRITQQTALQEDLLKTNQELQKALDAVKTLRGILPVCLYCNKIRDEKGSWSQWEEYIYSRSDAEFSHGICPDCYKIQMDKGDYPDR